MRAAMPDRGRGGAELECVPKSVRGGVAAAERQHDLQAPL